MLTTECVGLTAAWLACMSSSYQQSLAVFLQTTFLQSGPKKLATVHKKKQNIGKTPKFLCRVYLEVCVLQGSVAKRLGVVVWFLIVTFFANLLLSAECASVRILKIGHIWWSQSQLDDLLAQFYGSLST